MGFELNLDLKQHINLSAECWNCIYSDIRSFSTRARSLTLNGLLNTIISNYWQDAEASISLRLEEMEDNLKKTLCARSKKDETIKQLLAIEEKRLRELNTYSPHGKGKQFLINAKQKDILELDCNEEEYYGGKAGKYLHSLFEEYARLPYYKRERIIFDDTVKILNLAIKEGYSVKLNTDGKVFNVQPYKLLSDTDNTYNYLVGYSAPISKPATDNNNSNALQKIIASFRLARISHVTIMYNNRQPLSYTEAEDIDIAVNERGVAFLLGKPCTIKAKLSPIGVNLYSVILQGRPSFTKINDKQDEEGWTEYEFYCTERQAMNYFTRLGKEAVVTEPASLVTQMIQSLEKSLENYKTKSNF